MDRPSLAYMKYQEHPRIGIRPLCFLGSVK